MKSKLLPLSLSNSGAPFFLSVFSAAPRRAAPGCLQGRVSEITPSLFVVLLFCFVFFLSDCLNTLDSLFFLCQTIFFFGKAV